MESDLDKNQELIEGILSASLGFEVKSIPGPIDPDKNGQFLTGIVQIAGSWEGSVAVVCSNRLSGLVAGNFFDKEPSEVTPEEIKDAIGELANIICGTVQGLLANNTYLSLPAVVEGINYELSIRHSKVLKEMIFESEGEPVLVTILKREKQRMS